VWFDVYFDTKKKNCTKIGMYTFLIWFNLGTRKCATFPYFFVKKLIYICLYLRKRKRTREMYDCCGTFNGGGRNKHNKLSSSYAREIHTYISFLPGQMLLSFAHKDIHARVLGRCTHTCTKTTISSNNGAKTHCRLF